MCASVYKYMLIWLHNTGSCGQKNLPGGRGA